MYATIHSKRNERVKVYLKKKEDLRFFDNSKQLPDHLYIFQTGRLITQSSPSGHIVLLFAIDTIVNPLHVMQIKHPIGRKSNRPKLNSGERFAITLSQALPEMNRKKRVQCGRQLETIPN